ncbi:phosphotransferase [Protaetiibacter sp. SSC-01]|uniref:phosphotransferase n=1 Tax=Protaetiibacter sp. SSC-01 TaxID=2759943 RepID=UPI0016570DB4|nr:phosphotransferase [Protaetiibacter sp. SSC-01]QNO37726.1 phosphotransferase [Protaetiibacter sp. SSC-01]
MSERMPHAALEAAVASAVGAGHGAHVAVDEVHRDGIDYDAFLAHRAVHRIRGTARVDGEPVPWSLVEKVTEGPAFASPYLYDNAEREHAAYTSGLLAELAPRVRAPALRGAECDAEGRITLWLEDVPAPARPLGADALLAAARDLGGLAAEWVGRVPHEEWLFTGWIDRHGQPGAVGAGLAVLRSRHPSAVARLGSHLDAAVPLLLAQHRVRGILESLPQTLCHHDAVGANVFQTEHGTVLIDWESVGPGSVGADLASLLLASVRRGDASIATVRAVLGDALDAYAEACAGVVPPELVRRGFDAAVCLRWKLIVDTAATLASGDPARRGSAPAEEPERSMDELVGLVDVLIGAAERTLG